MATNKSLAWRAFTVVCLAHGCWFIYKALNPDTEMATANIFVRVSKGELLRSFYFWTFVGAGVLSALAALAAVLRKSCAFRAAQYAGLGLILLVAAAYLKTRWDQKNQTVIENMMAESAYENINFWLVWVGVYAAVIALVAALKGGK